MKLEPNDDNGDQELLVWLREEYGVEPRNLDLSPAEQAAVDGWAHTTAVSLAAHIAQSETIAPPVSGGHSAPGAPAIREKSDASRRWRKPALLAAAAIVIMAVAWSFIVGIGGSEVGHAGTPTLLSIEDVDPSDYPLSGVDADEALERLASIAEDQPETKPSGSVQHVTMAGWWLRTEDDRSGKASSTVAPVISQSYRSEETVRLVTQRGVAVAADGRVPDMQGDLPVVSDESFPVSPDDPLADPHSLPLDPAELRNRLIGEFLVSGECAGNEGSCLTSSIQTLGQGHIVSPALNAALLRTLIGASDLSYIGPARDRIGRTSEVFAVADPDHERQRLFLFDSQTGVYSGDETVLVRDSDILGLQAPAVIEFNAVIARSWVDLAVD